MTTTLKSFLNPVPDKTAIWQSCWLSVYISVIVNVKISLHCMENLLSKRTPKPYKM